MTGYDEMLRLNRRYLAISRDLVMHVREGDTAGAARLLCERETLQQAIRVWPDGFHDADAAVDSETLHRIEKVLREIHAINGEIYRILSGRQEEVLREMGAGVRSRARGGVLRERPPVALDRRG